ncbi:hypothetical protein DY023_03020 [Microbacterium bovistercoris]|uniref:Uncharacterized protein n=2 Tax=Microbacterium bovistercoris TaxID=2293570 RepID=A0A371NWT5_9MICO|nr:hypothetical protein DY023_03020 [Microbacterium bovistercoris]
MAGLSGWHMLLIMPFVWAIIAGVVGLVVYFAVRFAVLHALKAHTRWVDAGKPAGATAAPYPPAGPAQGPAAPPQAPGAPPQA